MKKWWLGLAIAPVSFLLAGTACDRSPSDSTTAPETGEAIAIGVALAQTGSTSLLGQESVAGAKIAEAYFNEQGGIHGRPIRLLFQDTGAEEAGAIYAFQTLIHQQRVVGIVGPSSSQQAFSADPIAERAGVPVLGASNTAPGIPQIGDYIARVSAPVTVVAPYAVQTALRLQPQLKKVAVFYAQNDAFTSAETVIFQQAVRQAGLDLVTVQRFQTTDTDFQAQIGHAIAYRPDLVILSALAADGGNLVRQLRELGYGGLIIGGNGLNTSNIFPICQAWCDGVMIAQAYSPAYSSPINLAFRQRYRQRYQQEPPQFSAQAFSAVQVFVEALRQLDPQQHARLSLVELRSALNRQLLQGRYETPLGAIAFTPEGEVQQRQFYVAQIKMDRDGKQGKFVFIPSP